ncbi:MAG: rhomboid family intramembrane serine protease [Saprospiraceae bacterium]|nr:rhomboid family intramembrane serine protease [Candidatus Opimibacter skivensis]
MLSLYFMGPMVEMTLGPKRSLGLYMISGLTGLAAHFLVGMCLIFGMDPICTCFLF